ncbi:MAG TPA: ABC transporter ATP-binding protein [Candidatus Paceibacterota bacterium]|nr:ABC transporter ATP-binding protein [Candidatus Paceibacterota bacterium]
MKKTETVLGTKLILGLYWHEIRKHPWYVLGIFLMAPLAAFLNNFAVTYITAGVIDKLSRTGMVPLHQVWPTFGNSILLLVGAVVLGELILYRLLTYLVWNLEIKVDFNLYLRCFHHLSHQSAQFHANEFGGSLVSQTNKFVGGYSSLFDTLVFNVFPFFYSLAFTLIILGVRVPFFALGLAVISAVFIVFNFLSYGKVKNLNEIESEAGNKLSGHISDTITNILAVKSFGAEDRERKSFEDYNRKAMRASKEVMIAQILRDVGFGLALVALIGFMFVSILYGQALMSISIGTMILMLTYSLNLFDQLWRISYITRAYNHAYGNALPMAKILSTESILQDPEQPEEVRIQKGEVTFENISFTYTEENEAVFRNFSLSLKSGEKVGLVGYSGSGKSTLTKLLLRFADVERGAVKIDGQDIRMLKQAEFRKSIAYVPQEPLLFHRSIKENISYGKTDAADEEIYEAANRAQALEFIKGLPSGFDTLVGERGIKLSGGQRQRIVIARAVLKNAPILVLDEATSALDSESEHLIQKALRELMKNRTALVIAHRLSTIQKMDRIVVLEKGKIAEEGSHEELLERNGMYAAMWKRQSGGFIEE